MTKLKSARAAKAQSRSVPKPVAAAVARAKAGKATLEDIARAAAALDRPLWPLLIPGLHEHRELLVKGGLEGLEGVVENYLASTPAKRTEIEIVARAGAAVSRRRPELRLLAS